MPYAIITGGTQGMGKAIAERFLSEGFSVAIAARNKEKLQAVKAEWHERFPNSLVITSSADLSFKEEADAFGDLVISNFGSIDVLVNNAGMYLPGTIANEPDGVLDTMLGVNLYSAYYLTRKVLPAFKKAGRGHIFNMCSIASLKAYPNGGSYGIAKYAMLGFSENLREELKPDNIKVTAVCPGATYTPSWHGSGIDPARMMEASDIATMIWSAYSLSVGANVEMIVLRPVKGDI
jgi:short-subunit dehydrogenase